jgi:hypothetical protein
MTRTGVSSTRAFLDGVLAVVRAPLILIAVAAITMAIAAPFAAVIGSRVQASLASQPPVALDETEIDPEWWQEFRAQARGLEATFTPAIVGFAAPLDSISAVLDGRQPPLAVLGPLAISIVAWAFLWGGILSRYRAGHAIGVREFTAGGLRFMPRFVGIAMVAAVTIALLYVSLHALLFGPVHHWLASRAGSERGAFLMRVVLYAVFLAPVVLVGLLADYARVASVSRQAGTLIESLRAAAAFLRSNARPAIALYLLTSAVFVIVTVAYGLLEIYGGSRVGGWPAIAIGQAYVLFRLALRLTVAASELRLFASRTTP